MRKPPPRRIGGDGTKEPHRMVNRRRFLQETAAAALSVTPSASLFNAWSPRAPIQLQKVVFDQRFSAGRIFGAEAARLGAKVHAIRGDVTSLLYHDLSLRWA